MTCLFLSHSSQDSAAAEQVAGRLRAAGFAALFLDVDPDQGIPVGANWERELYTALRRSDGVVFLSSQASVASRWCFAELALARSLGRPIFPARISGGARQGLLGDVHEVDLADGEPAFEQLVAGLLRAGLNPSDSFGWDPTRSPYPGLAAFAAEDAAVFFGRSVETGRLMELLQPTLARGAGRW